MSNAEVVQAIFDSQMAGDFDRFIQYWHEDCEYTFPGENAVGRTYKGHEGMRDFWERLGSKLPELGFEVVRIFVDGDEAAIEWRDWGANEAGERYESWGISRMTLSEGRVKQARDLMDTQKMAAILGP